jgi:arsenate reductase-like glutaredoxin family protein
LYVYIKKFYPQLNFEFEQLLDASYNVWHRLNDEEKISLATFLEEISQESNHVRFY